MPIADAAPRARNMTSSWRGEQGVSSRVRVFYSVVFLTALTVHGSVVSHVP